MKNTKEIYELAARDLYNIRGLCETDSKVICCQLCEEKTLCRLIYMALVMIQEGRY